jgi:phospholipase C
VADHKLRVLPIGISMLMVLQPFSSAWAEERGAAGEKIAAARAQFLKAHERAADEARQRRALLRPEPPVSPEELVSLIQQKIKYVFVLYQENRSFDSYFGTFPNANGLFSQPASQTPGFVQTLVNTDGSKGTISPFRIGPAQYAADTDDIDHSHVRTVAKMDVQNGAAQMDMFAVTEELKYSPTGNPSLEAKQMGELSMAYEDCDTVPLLWAYADRFVLFDNVFEAMTGPSTPGNLSIIGAQSGQTQWALHPAAAAALPSLYLPVLTDNDPFWGGPSDKSASPLPINPTDVSGGYTFSPNLTYATLPLSMLLNTASTVTATDPSASTDLVDVQDDVNFLAKLSQPAVGFGWYEEGFDKESTDTAGPTDANGSHASYVTHHNGPQYFGYVANTPALRGQLHGLGDFFSDIQNSKLPKSGGVFYVKGGYENTLGLLPANPNATVQKNFIGDDDHPAYSDAQISEAMVATAINAIAASPYWPQSAIIITWDDSEGDYDHVPPPIVNYGPDKSAMSFGPRVPLILISPYAKLGYVSHVQGSHSSVVKFVDTVFGLPPLATLPDELLGRYLGLEVLGQEDLGPQDAITPGVSDLLDAFSTSRLMGIAEPLAPDYVQVDPSVITKLPPTTGLGCGDLGILTTDRQLGIQNNIPSDFNPRPKTNPTPAAAAVAAH